MSVSMSVRKELHEREHEREKGAAASPQGGRDSRDLMRGPDEATDEMRPHVRVRVLVG